MAESTDTDFGNSENSRSGVGVSTPDLSAWFIREVFPLEPTLMQFLQRYWRNESDLADLRQAVYLRVYEAARTKRPNPVKPFLFTVARGIIIDKVRRDRIVPIDAVADLESLDIASDAPTPDRSVIARDELRRLQTAIDGLPPRCREAVILAQVEGLNGQEIAARMGISKSTVSQYLHQGVRLLATLLYSKSQDMRRAP
jgi:RNA polymerase sigma factor (sigma-70 family)